MRSTTYLRLLVATYAALALLTSALAARNYYQGHDVSWPGAIGMSLLGYIAYGLWHRWLPARNMGLIYSGGALAIAVLFLGLLLTTGKTVQENLLLYGAAFAFSLVCVLQVWLLTRPSVRDAFRKPNVVSQSELDGAGL